MNDAVGPYITKMSQKKIHQIIAGFGKAAVLAKQAGFDMVQVHGDRMCGSLERLQSVKPGDSITVLYEERTPNYTVNLIEGNRFVIEDELRLSVKQLPDGYFQSYIVVTDIFGKQYYSNDAVLLKSNGQIVIETISDEVDHGLV